MGDFDLTTILIIAVAFLVGYAGVSWVYTLVRRGLAPPTPPKEAPPRMTMTICEPIIPPSPPSPPDKDDRAKG